MSRTNRRDRPEQKIEEIVYEVEAGQLAPWTATRRLVRLFESCDRLVKVEKRGRDERAIAGSHIKG